MPRTFNHYVNALYHVLSLENHQELLTYNISEIYNQTLEDAFNRTQNPCFKVHQVLTQEFDARVSYTPKNCISKANLNLIIPIAQNDNEINSLDDQVGELDSFSTVMGNIVLEVGHTYNGTGIVIHFSHRRKTFNEEAMQEIVDKIRNIKNHFRIAA